MNKKLKNPWARRMQHIEKKYGLEAGFEELKEAEERGYKICACGARAWFKPSVGTYVCRCGKLLRNGTFE